MINPSAARDLIAKRVYMSRYDSEARKVYDAVDDDIRHVIDSAKSEHVQKALLGVVAGATSDGSVYAIRSLDLIKIGHTSRLDERLRTMEAGSAAPMVWLWSSDGDSRIETWLQSALFNSHVRNEWFKLSEDMLEFLDLASVITSEMSHRELMQTWLCTHCTRFEYRSIGDKLGGSACCCGDGVKVRRHKSNVTKMKPTWRMLNG